MIKKPDLMPLPDTKASMLEHALYYAKQGIKVFPTKPKTKNEYYADYEHLGAPSKKYPHGNPYSWQAQATDDVQRITKIWTEHPDANVCGVMGNGLYAIDGDVRENGSWTDSIKKWKNENILPGDLNLMTWTSITGSGGTQLFYFLPPELVENAKKHKIDLAGDAGMIEDGSHVDTRGDGRYVVLPPSIHPNGKPYTWDKEKNPSTIPIANFDRTVEYIFTHKAKKKRSKNEHVNAEPGELIPHGSRRKYMTQKAGELVNKMADFANDSAIVAALMDIAHSDLDLSVPLESGWEGLQDDLEKMVYDFRLSLNKEKEDGKKTDWTYCMRAWYMEHPGEELQKPINWNEVKEAGDRRKKNEAEGIKPEKPPDAVKDNSVTEKPKQFDIKLVQGRKLQQEILPPIVYPIERMIPQGYTVASAPFKYGKSWLALEMCLAVAEGKDFLGLKTTKGAAVYLALEDCEQFAQERLNIALGGRECPEDFYYIMEGVPTLDDGLIDYLDQLYDTVKDLKLVVIDILAKVEYQQKKNETVYKCDYRTGGALKKWADDHLVSLIAITHTTKMTHPEDIFMNTIGSSGVSGTADALLTIAKEKRTDKDALLAITGRRVRELYLKVHLDDGYMWNSDGEVDPDTMQADQVKQEHEVMLKEYHESPIRDALIRVANMGIDRELSATGIIDKARELDIYMLNTAAEVGLFIRKYRNYLYTEDGVKVFIHNRGSGSNLYKLEAFEPADDEAAKVYDWDDEGV